MLVARVKKTCKYRPSGCEGVLYDFDPPDRIDQRRVKSHLGQQSIGKIATEFTCRSTNPVHLTPLKMFRRHMVVARSFHLDEDHTGIPFAYEVDLTALPTPALRDYLITPVDIAGGNPLLGNPASQRRRSASLPSRLWSSAPVHILSSRLTRTQVILCHRLQHILPQLPFPTRHSFQLSPFCFLSSARPNAV